MTDSPRHPPETPQGYTPAHLRDTSTGPQPTQPWNADQAIDAGDYKMVRVCFDSAGTEVVGNLFVPHSPGRKAAVVLLGPVAFVKEQAPMQYASRLARQGFVTLIFDPRHHGESGGEPRRFESGQAKAQDLRAAVAWLSGRPEMDPGHVHLLGICQGVNWVVEAATGQADVNRVALVAGHYLLPQTAQLYLGSAEKVAQRLARAEASKARFDASGEVDYIPIVSLTDPDALLLPRPIHDFYYHWADRGPFAGHRGFWENRITRMSELEVWGHRVDQALQRLDKPLLMVHSDKAATGAEIPRALFAQVPSGAKSSVWLDGRNQAQFYQDPATIDAVVHQLVPFFDTTGA